MRFRDAQKLSLIVVSAASVRTLTLFAGRAEFAGWLNHVFSYGSARFENSGRDPR